ncbi:MAG: preprotein translocase subunit SecA, partial [Leptospiraceae bacterium]|nr:preprotein translocase subunit SecA [Leptospiraceae bacterium]
MIQKTLNLIFGSKYERDLKKLIPVVEKINILEEKISNLSDLELKNQTHVLKEMLAKGDTLDDILPEAFATVRETAKRTLGLRHYDVQMMGATALHQGNIAEMKTGEGKTLTSTLAIYLNSLAGKGVHVVTVNDYLAKRDANWMKPIYEFLGVTVGIIQHDMEHDERKEAYQCDITYGTNNEFGFDYLRDNMVSSPDHKVQREHFFAIVDEVDSI